MSTRPIVGRKTILSVAAAVLLLLGYADLVRGGETLTPILLVAGYLVLIPLALLARRHDAPNE